MTTNVLSIDYDFWAHPKQFTDWGTHETMLFINHIWPMRAASIQARGQTLTDVVDFPTDEPQPSELPFWLRDRNCSIRSLTLAESHQHAPEAFDKVPGKLNVFHIDAHHDFGYSDNETYPDEPTHLECGNWLLHLLFKERLNSVTMVFPKWRKHDSHKAEVRSAERRAAAFKAMGVKVRFCFGLHSLWVQRRTVFAKAFICRSGAWVPPWLDSGFLPLFMGLMTLNRLQKYDLYNQKKPEDFPRKLDTMEINHLVAGLRKTQADAATAKA
jgi:hypothetical protein